MAALLRQIIWKPTEQIFLKCDGLLVTQVRCITKKKYKIPTVKQPYKHLSWGPTYEQKAQALSYRGYLRSQKSYTPSSNVAEDVLELKLTSNLQSGHNGRAFTLEEKFKFLNLCAEKFDHVVPNSLLHELITVSDVINFYKTPVDSTFPIDAFKTIDLPENLHVQYEPLRFHAETDTKFGGETAYPKSSTIVSGLKAKKKYKGFKAKMEWHEYQ